MTEVHMLRDSASGLLTGAYVAGHSGYAERGSDIVCAAVTSAVRLTDCILCDEMKLDTGARVDSESVRLSLPVTQAESPEVQQVLKGFELYIRQIEREYPAHVHVIEREE